MYTQQQASVLLYLYVTPMFSGSPERRACNYCIDNTSYFEYLTSSAFGRQTSPVTFLEYTGCPHCFSSLFCSCLEVHFILHKLFIISVGIVAQLFVITLSLSINTTSSVLDSAVTRQQRTQLHVVSASAYATLLSLSHYCRLNLPAR